MHLNFWKPFIWYVNRYGFIIGIEHFINAISGLTDVILKD